MDAGMEVMPTTVKQTKKLPSDIVLKISSKESKKVYCAMMLIVFCFFKNKKPLNNSCYVFPKTICQVYFCYLNS